MRNNALTPFFSTASKYLLGVVVVIWLWPYQVAAQLEVTDTLTDQEIAQKLAGKGVDISNVTVDCPPSNAGPAYGYFDASNANLNFAEGLLMTTGAASDAIGPNDNSGTTRIIGSSGDSDLDQYVSPQSSQDACVFEFDVEPTGDTLTFNYSFGSEEYPEYVCSNYNDVFGFFITGPDPSGGNYVSKNIAFIPNTTTEVAINSVNVGQPGSNSTGNCTSLNYSQYYIDNGDGNSAPQNSDSTVLQYDGFTDGLYVEESVIPCQTYHLKLAIADVSDPLLDSGVFLEAGSVQSNEVKVKGETAAGGGSQNAIEGCLDGIFRFIMNKPSADSTVVNFNIGGMANNGVDYATIPDSVVLPPGDTVTEIRIDAFDDGTSEPIEDVELYLLSKCNNQPYDTAEVFIQDQLDVETGKPDSLTICQGDSVQFQATGGISYKWSPSRGLSDTTGNDPVATPDSSTTYVVSTQYANCYDDDSTHINVIPTNFNSDLPSDTTICKNQSVQLDPNVQLPAGFNVNWSPSNSLSDTSILNPVASPTDSTTYYLKIYKGNCILRDTTSVHVAPALNATVDGQSIFCTGNQFGKAWATAFGGVPPYSYQWSNGQNTDTITNLNDGTYIVTVTDSVNCKQIDTFKVTQITPPVIDSINSQDIACHGDSSGQASVFFSAGTAPYDISWSNGDSSQTISSLPSDTFSVSITDTNHCSDADTIVIDEPPLLEATIDSIKDPTCPNSNDGLISVAVNGGTPPYTFEWDDTSNQTSQVATGLDGGTYHVTVTDDSGCTVVDTAILEQPDSFQIDITVEETISCFNAQDGIAKASVSGDTSKHSFIWANQTGPVASGLSTGTHTVTVTTDSSGCQQTASITLTQPDSISLSTNKSDILCYGDTSGTASVTASGANGPPFSYNWSTGDTTSALSGLPAGSYGVSVADTNNCTNTATVTIRQPQALQLTTSTTPLSCNSSADGSATVEVTGGVTPYTYTWSDADSQTTATAQGLTNGNYTVTVTDDNGCTTTATVLVATPDPLRFSQLDVVDESCPGAEDGAVFAKAEGGTAPYEYRLEGNGSSAEGVFNGLKGDKEYQLTIEDGNGCILDTLITVAQPEEVAITFQPDRLSVELGQGKELSPILSPEDTGAYEYMWEPSTGLSCVDCRTPEATPYQQTNYELTLLDENGCRYSGTIEVDVQNPETLYIPSAFTPDGNDQNDEFRIYGKNINRIHLQIFNRWGELVFETKDPSEGWDGAYKGKDASTGVYVYHAVIHYFDGTTEEKQGSVTLIR